MFEFLRLFYDIILFKKTPQNIPFSPFLTRITWVMYALINFVMLFMQSHWSSALLEIAVGTVMLMIFTRVTLAWVHKLERYQQTFCALLGTDALITFSALPATAVTLIPTGNIAVLGLLIMIALMLWHWAVIGYILSHALDQPLGFSLGLALLYVMIIYGLMEFLFPVVNASY